MEQALTVRRARADEAAAISALALASKAVWGYSREQMAVFRDELTLLPDAVEASHTHVLTGKGGDLLGFYCFAFRSDGRLELQHLFVDANRLREGLGRLLLDHARGRAAALGHASLVIQSDPNAEGFYLAAGARLLERIPSSIPGRTIPFLALGTDATCQAGARV